MPQPLADVGSRVAGGVGRPVLDGVFETIDASTDVVLKEVRRLGGDVAMTYEVA